MQNIKVNLYQHQEHNQDSNNLKEVDHNQGNNNQDNNNQDRLNQDKHNHKADQMDNQHQLEDVEDHLKTLHQQVVGEEIAEEQVNN